MVLFELSYLIVFILAAATFLEHADLRLPVLLHGECFRSCAGTPRPLCNKAQTTATSSGPSPADVHT